MSRGRFFDEPRVERKLTAEEEASLAELAARRERELRQEQIHGQSAAARAAAKALADEWAEVARGRRRG